MTWWAIVVGIVMSCFVSESRLSICLLHLTRITNGRHVRLVNFQPSQPCVDNPLYKTVLFLNLMKSCNATS